MRRVRRSITKRLLFLLVLAALLWLAVEVLAFVAYRLVRGEGFSFARVHAAQAVRARSLGQPAADAAVMAFQDSGGDTCIHPYLGFVANRDTDDQMLLPARGYGVTRYGFVDEDGPVRKRAPRTALIGVFGGSVAEFFSEEGAEELATRLRAHPRFADTRIEFVRLGLAGFKQPQQLLALTYLLALGGELDLAINLDGFNEATLGPLENVPRGVAALFPRNWSLLVENAPDPEQRRRIGAFAVLQEAQRRLAVAFGRGPWRWSVAASVTWDALDRWLYRQAAAQLVALQAHRRDDLPFHTTGMGADPGTSADDLAGESVATWARCSRAMQRICAAHGIRYFHFLQPNQYDEGSKQLTADELRTAFDPGSRYRSWVQRTYPRLRAAGQELATEGVAFTDLSRVFADAAGPIYVDNCCHVNAEGNRRLALAIAAAIVGDDGGGPKPPRVVRLRAESTLVHLRAPFARHELRLFGAGPSGEETDVTYASGIGYTSSAPGIVAVDRYGVLTAFAGGDATVRAELGEASAMIEVRVELPAVVDLGGAHAPPGLLPPRLSATVEDGAWVLRITPAGPNLVGAVCFATEPAARAFCGGRVYVPLASPKVTPLPASAGELRVPFLSPDPRCRTVYVQAVYQTGGEVCGFAVSNALAITP